MAYDDHYLLKHQWNCLWINKKKALLVFEDIPYAQPPIGDLRWKAPKEIK